MCLNIKNNSKALIAEENKSEHHGYTYVKHKTNPLIKIEPITNYGFISVETHINEGYHSYVNKPAYYSSLFIIPKGTEYYLGGINGSPYWKDGYCSETIIFVGKNNWWNRFWQGRKYKVKF
jgi:hypothetical protein